MKNRVTINFEDFVRYRTDSVSKATDIDHLPKTRKEFDSWWQKISVCPELQGRWTNRILHGDRLTNETAIRIAAFRKAA